MAEREDRLPPLEKYERLLREAEQIRGVSLGQDAWRRIRKNRTSMLALGYLLALAVLTVLTPLLPLQSPKRQFTQRQFQPPVVIPAEVVAWFEQLFAEESDDTADPNAESAAPTVDAAEAADDPRSLDLVQYAFAAGDETDEEQQQRRESYANQMKTLFPEDLTAFDHGLIYLRLLVFGDWCLPSVCGTDDLGRDLFSQLFWGSRVSLAVGLVATLVSLLIGVTWGAVAGFLGGLVDEVMMRVVDILYSIPFIFVVLFVLTILNDETIQKNLREWGITQLTIFFIAIGAIYWLTMARVVRGQIISLKNDQFVEAARTIGAGNARIIFLHLVPNVLSVVIVYLTLTIPSVILFEAFLSFLGLGVKPPNVSWGLLADQGVKAISPLAIRWWMIIFPGGILAVTLLALNFLGDGLRDALDPRLKNR